jgi:hypothetical protein
MGSSVYLSSRNASGCSNEEGSSSSIVSDRAPERKAALLCAALSALDSGPFPDIAYRRHSSLITARPAPELEPAIGDH